MPKNKSGRLADKSANQDKINVLKKQAAENLQGWQRAKADYLNLKKEMEEKLIAVDRRVKGELLLDFLPVYENLLTAFEHIPSEKQNDDWAVGFLHVKKQLENFFAKAGLERIEVTGRQFDHNLHEAVKTERSEDKEDNEILEEVSPGYKLDGEVLIHPKVVVNQIKANN